MHITSIHTHIHTHLEAVHLVLTVAVCTCQEALLTPMFACPCMYRHTHVHVDQRTISGAIPQACTSWLRRLDYFHWTWGCLTLLGWLAGEPQEPTVSSLTQCCLTYMACDTGSEAQAQIATLAQQVAHGLSCLPSQRLISWYLFSMKIREAYGCPCMCVIVPGTL